MTTLADLTTEQLQAELERRNYVVESINTPQQLARFADELGLRMDWHEPDEQELTARIRGNHLDNAMGSTMRDIGDDNEAGEFNVVLVELVEQDGLQVTGRDLAVVNLADLLAWATQGLREAHR